ncbi:MAG TPA: hypothetical protein VHB25_15885 [Gemmatimonadaceae bacterium]|nr:hypothetical protein [Gemmatimonadaceae bacterium]
MSAMLMQRKISRTVALRLAAGVLPSVLGVGLVIGLFYYGALGRQAPGAVLALATMATIGTLVIAWINAKYFADRLARLARVTGPASRGSEPTDEFDRIERAVGNLGTALTAAEAERARSDAIAAARLRDQGTMLAGVVTDAIAQLDGVRLPLQILLESPFGELNENQEELLRDARAAADEIDGALRRLGQVADIDREAVAPQLELVQINDVVRSILPLARAAAERCGARTEAVLEPGLPRTRADRARLAAALSLLSTAVAEHAGPERPLVISTGRDGARTVVTLAPAIDPPILAARLIALQGGALVVDHDTLVLRIGSPA